MRAVTQRPLSAAISSFRELDFTGALRRTFGDCNIGFLGVYDVAGLTTRTPGFTSATAAPAGLPEFVFYAVSLPFIHLFAALPIPSPSNKTASKGEDG